MSKKFEVSFNDRNEQRKETKKLVWYRATGRERYRVYEKRQEPKDNGFQHKGVKTQITTIKPRWASVQYANLDTTYVYKLYNFIFEPRYETKWLLPQEATALTIIGHQVVEL